MANVKRKATTTVLLSNAMNALPIKKREDSSISFDGNPWSCPYCGGRYFHGVAYNGYWQPMKCPNRGKWWEPLYVLGLILAWVFFVWMGAK